MTLRLAECLPGLTPAAVINLPWVYAMGILWNRIDDLERAAGHAPAGYTLPPAEPVASASGVVHGRGFSTLMGMLK